MCFSLQRRAIFGHHNFKKWSEADVFCAFWLENMLPATAACNFSCLLWAATSAPAALASLLFDPADPQIIGKTQHFATFARVYLLSSDFRAIVSSFFWLYFSSLLFHLLTLLLCFSTLHMVGSFTSKLPLVNHITWIYPSPSGKWRFIRTKDVIFLVVTVGGGGKIQHISILLWTSWFSPNKCGSMNPGWICWPLSGRIRSIQHGSRVGMYYKILDGGSICTTTWNGVLRRNWR